MLSNLPNLKNMTLKFQKGMFTCGKNCKIEKKIRVGADQTFQLAIREISINRCQS
jgi:hypothetical protein